MCLIFVALLIYTTITISNHGWNLVPIFFGDMFDMTWPGQFNFDFFGFLLLSGLWVAWRHQFSAIGLLLSVFAVFGGMMFLSLYLFIETNRSNGDVRELLLGKSRVTS
jgi:hypothetical protein